LLPILKLSRRSGCAVLPAILQLRVTLSVTPQIESRMQRCDWALVDDGREIRGSPGVITRDLIGRLLGGSQVSKARPGAPFDFYRHRQVRESLVSCGFYRHRPVRESLVSFDFYRRLDREAAKAVGIPTNLRERGLDFGQCSLELAASGVDVSASWAA
jgi:hypothetical protein